MLAAVGLIPAPGQLMNTPFSLVLGMTYTYLPFMILPLYSNLSKMDLRLLEAAADLGATRLGRVLDGHRAAVASAGIIAGSMLVFIPCVGEYVIPELLGGPQTLMIGRVLWDEFFSNNDWPMACAVAVVMVLLIIVPLAVFNSYQAEAHGAPAVSARPARRSNSPAGSGAAGSAPASSSCTCRSSRWCSISFNDSPVPNVWRGFTLKWYARARRRPRDAGRPVAVAEDRLLHRLTSSVVLGTLAAFALVKYRRFTGRTLFSGMVNAPLVMPEVIIGLSLLLMLVSVQRALGFPERGMATIWLGHLLLGMAYATVVVQARLQDLNPQLEEAAMDLGARPWQVFYLVTLPMIAQALLSAWLLTFTLSLDDVVLSAFLSGPGATTMPLVIFSRARLGLNPSVNAVATLIVLVVSIGVIAASWLIARQERQRALDVAAAARTT